jgi:hypothetical protein
MPFVVPVNFVSGDPILASDLNTNNRALRKYLNQEIAPQDLADSSVDSPEIVRGEYFQVVPDHQFTSGNIYSHYASTSIRDRQYLTGQTKNTVDFVAYTAYEIVPESGKRFYCEDTDMKAMYHVAICPHMPEDQLSFAGYTTGEHIQLKVFINDTATDYSFAYSFQEISASPATPPSGTGKADNQYRWYPMCIFTSALPQGWNTIDIRIDTQSSHSIVHARSAYIELFHT